MLERGGGRSLWHCLLAHLARRAPYAPAVPSPHRQGLGPAPVTWSPSACPIPAMRAAHGHLCSVPASARARNIHLRCSRSQGKSSTEEDTVQERGWTLRCGLGAQSENLRAPLCPSPWDCVGLYSGSPGAQGLCLAGSLVTSHQVFVRDKGGNIDTERQFPFVYSPCNLD